MNYFDYAATTPCHPDVIEAMNIFHCKKFGNESSQHQMGFQAKRSIEKASESIAQSINCQPKEIIYTSGATESNNLILKGIAEKHNYQGHIITSSIEHDCILDTCVYLETKGINITYLPVNQQGITDVNQLKQAIQKDTILISIMFANNETGSIQPIEKIGNIAQEHSIPFHTDAVQAFQYTNIDVKQMNIQSLSLSGHKLHGPKGIGILYLKQHTHITPQIHGGSQQLNKRAGTMNTPGIIGIAEAIKIIQNNKPENTKCMRELHSYCKQQLYSRFPDIHLTVNEEDSAPHIIHCCFAHIDGKSLVTRMSNQGISLSNGSACSSGNASLSHVVQALNLPNKYKKGATRISFSNNTSKQNIDHLIKILHTEVQALQDFI
jgi:cysteine desulfurase